MLDMAPRLSYNSQASFLKRQSNAELAHLVERHLAKVEVASSSLVFRSTRKAPLSSGAFLRSRRKKSPLRARRAGGFAQIFIIIKKTGI